MRHLLLIAAFAVAAPPAVAQEEEAERGLSLMERGARLFFDGLMQEMDPALEEMGRMADEVGPAIRSFTREMGPALADLMSEIEDFSAYHPPEILPNGDIIMRKKTPEERAAPGETEPGKDIEI